MLDYQRLLETDPDAETHAEADAGAGDVSFLEAHRRIPRWVEDVYHLV